VGEGGNGAPLATVYSLRKVFDRESSSQERGGRGREVSCSSKPGEGKNKLNLSSCGCSLSFPFNMALLRKAIGSTGRIPCVLFRAKGGFQDSGGIFGKVEASKQ